MVSVETLTASQKEQRQMRKLNRCAENVFIGVVLKHCGKVVREKRDSLETIIDFKY